MKENSFKYCRYFPLIFVIFLCGKASAQLGLSLQVEVINSLEKVEFYVGQQIEYTVKAYPNEWRKDKLTKILIEENVILLENEILNIDQIDQIRTTNFGAKVIGGMLFTFGASWNLFGVFATLTSNFEFTGRELFIGLGSMGSGWLISKLLRYKVYTIDRGSRLRIIDRRFSVDESRV